MITQTSTKNVPKLRFPEFHESWHTKPLGTLGKFVGGGTPSKNIQKYWSGNIPWVSSSDIPEDNIRNISYTRRITQEALDNSATKLIPANSVLVVSRVGVGKLAVNDRDVCTSQDFTNIIPTSVDPVFLAYLLKSKRHRLLGFNQGTSIKGFTTSDLATLGMHTPDANEQQKVASFLKTIDDRIMKLEKKIKLQQGYKKSITQKIFSQKIRFRDERGNPFPKWQNKRLREVYNFRRTNSLSRDELGAGGKTRNIHYGDIHALLPARLDATIYDLPTIKNPAIQFSDADLCKAGDVVMADASEDYIDIGKCIEIIDTAGERVVAGLHTLLLRPNSTIIIGFGLYLLRSEAVRKQIVRMATGVSVLGISKNNLAQVALSVPSREEQQKITNLLSKIDDSIKLYESKLEWTKHYKKIMLQRMFV